MSPLPTGTVTFLFSDIEGSTQRWERQPDQMEYAFNRHEELMRTAMEEHGGYVYKMIGDAFQVAFSTAPQAVAAALAAQWALYDEPWGQIEPIKVRMALHTGETEERIDDYVEGEPLPFRWWLRKAALGRLRETARIRSISTCSRRPLPGAICS